MEQESSQASEVKPRTVMLSPDAYALLVEQARHEGRTLGGHVRYLLEHYEE